MWDMETLIKEGRKNEKTHRIVCRFLCCLRFLRRLVSSLFQFYEEVRCETWIRGSKWLKEKQGELSHRAICRVRCRGRPRPIPWRRACGRVRSRARGFRPFGCRGRGRWGRGRGRGRALRFTRWTLRFTKRKQYKGWGSFRFSDEAR